MHPVNFSQMLILFYGRASCREDGDLIQQPPYDPGLVSSQMSFVSPENDFSYSAFGFVKTRPRAPPDLLQYLSLWQNALFVISQFLRSATQKAKLARTGKTTTTSPSPSTTIAR